MRISDGNNNGSTNNYNDDLEENEIRLISQNLEKSKFILNPDSLTK